MPLREYECGCGTRELLIPPEKPPEPYCKKCGEEVVEQITCAAIHMDYLGIENFGDPRYAEARAKQCGVET